jgi:hypothetical protein
MKEEILTQEEILELVDRVWYGVPESKADALRMSLAKWHPSRGSSVGGGLCGLCEMYQTVDGCGNCPLIKDGLTCNDNGHVWQEFNAARIGGHVDLQISTASKVYNEILLIYKKEIAEQSK